VQCWQAFFHYWANVCFGPASSLYRRGSLVEHRLPCRELDDLHSGAIKKGPLPDSRPEGEETPQDGDLVRVWAAATSQAAPHACTRPAAMRMHCRLCNLLHE
jgi:hypothetical protein